VPTVVELRGDSAEDAERLMGRLTAYQTKLPVNTPRSLADKIRRSAPVAELLDDVAKWYSFPGRCKRRRPLRFRRFRMAQQAYGMWQERGVVDADRVQLLQERCEQAAYAERGGLLNELNRLRGKAVQRNMQAAATLYGTGAVLAALTFVPVVEWVVRHVWVHRPARRWFQHKLGAPTPQAMYEALCEVGHQGEDVWDQWLTDAFLADIDAYHHRGRRLNRSRLPLLLVPEAAAGTPGDALLRHLLGRQAGTDVPRSSSPVVVAHTGGGLADLIVTRDGVVQGVLAGGKTFQLPKLPADENSAPPPVSTAPGPVASALAGVLAAALLTGGLLAGPTVAAGMHCGQGVSLWPDLVQRDGQCIGVTDGGSGGEFLPALAKVSQAIEDENEKAEQSGEYATVALMLPMTPGDPAETRQVLNEVKGAYLAQWEANEGARLGEQRPAVRLVLANPGRGYEHWKDVTGQLIAMADDPVQKLRAVTGFNLSVDSTERAISALTLAGVPVVGGPVTADEMENKRFESGGERYPGMARIVPTNSEQASALVNHNRRTPKEDTVLVVDTRAGDTYNKSLADAFRKAVPSSTKDREFHSPGPDELGDVANQFRDLVDLLCDQGAHHIYFAGRPLHLRSFLHQLAMNPCGNLNFEVITGSGASTVASQLSDEDWKELGTTDAQGNRKITVQYSAAGHPEEWERGALTGAAKNFYASSRQEMRDLQALNSRLASRMGGRIEWADSRAMTSHDSVYVAVNAIKRAYLPDGGGVPGAKGVAQQWAYTYANRGVAGATGMICLDNSGNPYNKAVAIVTLDPSIKSVRFNALAWPEKKPSRTCDVPGEN
jgi:ABC-type branched-subunit amino acid transport system substrate-binding protein